MGVITLAVFKIQLRLFRCNDKLSALPSAITSLNHKAILESKQSSAQANQYSALTKPCMVRTPEVVRVNKLTQVKIGQGDGDTKWNGWPWKWLLCKLDIMNIDNNKIQINIV